MNKKLLTTILSITMVTSSVSTVMAIDKGSNNSKIRKTVICADKSMKIQDQIMKVAVEQGVKNLKSYKRIKLLVLSDGSDITSSLRKVGASVDKKSKSVYLVEIPVNKSCELGKLKAVKAVGMDRMLSLPKPIKVEDFMSKEGDVAYPKLEYSHVTTGINKFWNEGYTGKGTKIGIIDTGVEPNNEMLTLTMDGKIKIVDYQDFWSCYGQNSEGDVFLEEQEVKLDEKMKKKYVEFNDKKIILRDDAKGKVLVGGFDEKSLVYDGGVKHHDVNFNGVAEDKIPVIVMNYGGKDKSNSQIIIDTNMDYNMEDEKEMGVYKEIVKGFNGQPIFEMDGIKPKLGGEGKPIVKQAFKKQYNRLINHFENLSKDDSKKLAQYNFVVTDFGERDGKLFVNLGYDGNGHGSHVAGDAAGNGYKKVPFIDKNVKDDKGNLITDGTLKGSAPDAQIIACRVFQSDHGTPMSVYMAAMEYASENGADVVNMSLGGLPDINDETSPSCQLVNQLTKKYGTIFCIAAGNEGPGLNSVDTPGSSTWAFAIGAYCSSYINYGSHVMENGMCYFSSRGPTEDGRLKPTVVAPGCMVSSTTMWEQGDARKGQPGGGSFYGYKFEQGTSMASPYAAGAVATLKQAIKENKIPYHPLVVREAMFETGNKKPDSEKFTPVDIGGGLIDVSKALGYLKGLKTKGLNQETLKDTDGYIDRNKIVLKTAFDYKEKLDYNPEGLYVRDGDIPSEVKVKITNTEGRDVNVKLKKESYEYSNEWLELPTDTLSLKKGECKELTLGIKKDKLNKGLNSLIIRMDDASTLLKDGDIPVTVINYMDLGAESPTVSGEDMEGIKLGKLRRYFVRIPYGTRKVEFDSNLISEDDKDGSSLRTFITEPTGIQKNMGLTQNATNANKTTKLKINEPMAGTWEIDLLSTVQTNPGIYVGKNTFDAKIRGIAMGPSVIKYSGKGGEYKENKVDFKVINVTDSDTKSIKICKTNLVSQDASIKTERVAIKNKEVFTREFSINECDPNLFVKIKTRNCENKSDDIDMELLKLSDDGKSSKKVGESGNSDGNEEISLECLDAGRYLVKITAFETAENSSFDYVMQLANSSSGENALNLEKDSLDLTRDLVKLDLGLRVPVKKGKYVGLIYAKDENNRMVGRVRVEAESMGTENNIDLDVDEIIRVGKDFDIKLNGHIKDKSGLNNVYGLQLDVVYDSSKISPKEIEESDIFKNTNVKVLEKTVESGKISYAVGLLNVDKNMDATGILKGTLMQIKMNAKALGDVKVNLNNILLVNHLGDEIAINEVVGKSFVIAEPDFINDGVINIRDICRFASKLGTTKDSPNYDATLDLNKDGVIDFVDFNFLINCFTEDI